MNWGRECERWHDTAMKKLRQTGRCPFRLRVYADGGVVDWTNQAGLSDEGRVRIRGMNLEFRHTPPIAILLCSDSWQAGPDFFRHHKIDHLPFEERRDRYSEILKREYRNSLKNVPEALKSEGVFTIVKGPGIGDIHRFSFYRRETSGNLSQPSGWREKIISVESPYGPLPLKGHFVSELIPDWWEAVAH